MYVCVLCSSNAHDGLSTLTFHNRQRLIKKSDSVVFSLWIVIHQRTSTVKFQKAKAICCKVTPDFPQRDRVGWPSSLLLVFP